MSQPPDNPCLTAQGSRQHGGYDGSRPGYPGGPPLYPTPQPSNGTAIASIVVGAIAAIICWVPIINRLAAVFALVGLGLGLGGLSAARRSNDGGGRAIGGIALSVTALAVALLINVVIVRWISGLQDATIAIPPERRPDSVSRPYPDRR